MKPEPMEVKRALTLCVELSAQIDSKDAVLARRAMQRLHAWPLTPNMKILLGRMFALLCCIDISTPNAATNDAHWVDFAGSVAFLCGSLIHYKDETFPDADIDATIVSYAEDIHTKATQ